MKQQRRVTAIIGKMNKIDGLLVLVLLVIAGIGYLVFSVGKSEVGNQVVITVNGMIYGTYMLNQDNEIEIKTEEGCNIVVIEKGKVYMKSADCPDEYCMRQGKISHSRESIICLPHKLVVEVVISKKESEEKRIDAIVQ